MDLPQQLKVPLAFQIAQKKAFIKEAPESFSIFRNNFPACESGSTFDSYDSPLCSYYAGSSIPASCRQGGSQTINVNSTLSFDYQMLQSQTLLQQQSPPQTNSQQIIKNGQPAQKQGKEPIIPQKNVNFQTNQDNTIQNFSDYMQKLVQNVKNRHNKQKLHEQNSKQSQLYVKDQSEQELENDLDEYSIWENSEAEQLGFDCKEFLNRHKNPLTFLQLYRMRSELYQKQSIDRKVIIDEVHTIAKHYQKPIQTEDLIWQDEYFQLNYLSPTSYLHPEKQNNKIEAQQLPNSPRLPNAQLQQKNQFSPNTQIIKSCHSFKSEPSKLISSLQQINQTINKQQRLKNNTTLNSEAAAQSYASKMKDDKNQLTKSIVTKDQLTKIQNENLSIEIEQPSQSQNQKIPLDQQKKYIPHILAQQKYFIQQERQQAMVNQQTSIEAQNKQNSKINDYQQYLSAKKVDQTVNTQNSSEKIQFIHKKASKSVKQILQCSVDVHSTQQEKKSSSMVNRKKAPSDLTKTNFSLLQNQTPQEKTSRNADSLLSVLQTCADNQSPKNLLGTLKQLKQFNQRLIERCNSSDLPESFSFFNKSFKTLQNHNCSSRKKVTALNSREKEGFSHSPLPSKSHQQILSSTPTHKFGSSGTKTLMKNHQKIIFRDEKIVSLTKSQDQFNHNHELKSPPNGKSLLFNYIQNCKQ